MKFILFDRRAALAGLAAALASCHAADPKEASGPARLDTDRLAKGYADIAHGARPGVLGFGVALLEPQLAWVSDAEARFPMQSVFKVFLVAAALAQVDAGGMDLGEPVAIGEQDLFTARGGIPSAWATARGAFSLPAIDLMSLAIQNSDNTAADALMRRLGGPGAVTAWLAGRALSGVRVDRYETEIQPQMLGMGPFQSAWLAPAAWEAARDSVPAAEREMAVGRYLADPRDTATLPASLDFLSRLARGQLLSTASTRLLLRLMTDCATGAARLKAGLPKGSSLAHKTGTSTTDLGLTAATNDIGVASLANGRRIALAAYLVGSTATAEMRARLIARAAALAASCVA